MPRLVPDRSLYRSRPLRRGVLPPLASAEPRTPGSQSGSTTLAPPRPLPPGPLCLHVLFILSSTRGSRRVATILGLLGPCRRPKPSRRRHVYLLSRPGGAPPPVKSPRLSLLTFSASLATVLSPASRSLRETDIIANAELSQGPPRVLLLKKLLEARQSRKEEHILSSITLRHICRGLEANKTIVACLLS